VSSGEVRFVGYSGAAESVYLEMAMRATQEELAIDRPPEKTFEAFFADRYEPVLRALFLLTGNRHDAEDLAQEAFFRVYERWDRLGDSANPAGYAYRVALNAHRSRLRRLARAAKRSLRSAERDPLEAADERDSIRRALGKLPMGQREALVLVEWVGLSDAQASEILGVRPEAVRMRVSRARNRLRDLLRGENDEE
jgi:RNA polymerase sigma-70 factor (sigma-E family)